MPRTLLLIAGAALTLAGSLLLDGRRWPLSMRRQVLPAASPRRRLLFDYYALVATIILTTTYLPLIPQLPSVWGSLAQRHPGYPQLQFVLIGSVALTWLCVCLACRWSLHSGLTSRARTIWWVSIGLAVLAWWPCTFSYVHGRRRFTTAEAPRGSTVEEYAPMAGDLVATR